MKRLYLLIFILLLAGCRDHWANPPDGPPAFQAGWQHGCRSGYVEAGHVSFGATRSSQWYGHNPDYTKGWDKGFKACRDRHGGFEDKPKHDGNQLLPRVGR